MNTQSLKILEYAQQAHTNQRRKYTGEPYISHPVGVHLILVRQGILDPDTLDAALLHDVVEDTKRTIEDIQVNFGTDVAKLVASLTKPTTGNRVARNAEYKEQLARADPRAKTIKLADILHNTQDVVEHDPKFAKVYLREKMDLLDALVGGDTVLFEKVKNHLTKSISEV